MLNAATLVPGTYYWVTVYLDDVGFGFAPPQSPVKLRVGTGTVYDSTATWPLQLGDDCNFSDPEIANWNAATAAALQVRLQASWCAWQDWNHVVALNNGTLMTGQYKSFNTNYLYNQGFEEPSNSPGSYAGPGTAYSLYSGSATRYCGDGAWPAFDDNCFVQFNKGSSPDAAIVLQDQPMPGELQQSMPTAEAAVRCRSGGPDCYVEFWAWARGPSSDEVRTVGFNVPYDTYWYICRLDYDHYGWPGNQPFSFNHSTLRWEIKQYSLNNVDLDYAFIGGQDESRRSFAQRGSGRRGGHPARSDLYTAVVKHGAETGSARQSTSESSLAFPSSEARCQAMAVSLSR